MNSIINFTDKLSYFSAKLIKKIEKKFGITLYYFFPLRFFLRMYEVIFFKKINENFVEFSNYYLPIKILNKKEILVLSGGVGLDIQFEKLILKKIDISKMILFDPTELTIDLKDEFNSNKVFYFKKALYSESRKMKIYKPFEKKDNPNLSLDNVYTDKSNYEIIKTIGILAVLRYSKFRKYTYQLFKFDIEGVADKVIIKCLDNDFLPSVINFELERPTSIFSQLNYFKRLFKLKKILKKDYNTFYYTNVKLGYRLELVAVKKTLI
tara:strand:+ start:40 stop:837 length:798 start_codon:yes stop_codon:yes gene_type:complete